MINDFVRLLYLTCEMENCHVLFYTKHCCWDIFPNHFEKLNLTSFFMKIEKIHFNDYNADMM